jgi:ubiquinone/menaquinone biosynthesis C-methylase UbiE
MSRSFVPALRFSFLTPIFDPFISVFMSETRIKQDLVKQARLNDAKDILDFGCGTATLTILIKRRSPDARVRGLDVDEAILAKAGRKAAAAGADVRFDCYDGGRFPYGNGSFDRVVTCLVLHHLDDTGKKSALREIARILRPAGELFIVDFDRSRSMVLRIMFRAIRLIDGRRNTRANASGAIRRMMSAAGFERVEELARHRTLGGEVTCLSGKIKPS